MSVARCFPEEILGLLESALLKRDPESLTVMGIQNTNLHAQYCIIISKLLAAHLDVLR